MKRRFTVTPVTASSANLSENSSYYTFYFGDGSSAASRGEEPENDMSVKGMLSSDALAFVAGNYIGDIYFNYGDNFTDDDVWDTIYESGDEIYEEDLADNTSEDWITALESKDISGGEPLLYKIESNGRTLYYNKELDELVHARYEE